MALGLLEPRGGTGAAPLFALQDAPLLSRAMRLRRDLGVNYAGAVLASELLGRIEELERGCARSVDISHPLNARRRDERRAYRLPRAGARCAVTSACTRRRRARAAAARIFSSADCSIWRTRSALTPIALPQLAQRPLGPVQAVARLDHATFAATQAIEQPWNLGGAESCRHLLVRLLGGRIAQQIAERRARTGRLVDVLLEASRLALGDDQPLQLHHRQLAVTGQLAQARFARVGAEEPPPAHP